MNQTLHIKDYAPGDLDALVALWDRAGMTRPHNDPVKDIEFAAKSPASTVLVGHVGGRLVASVMTGHDGHRGAVYYLAVDPDQQNSGYGKLMLQAAEDWLAARGVWKLNLMIRAENHAVRDFYLSCGYATEQRIVMARRIEKC